MSVRTEVSASWRGGHRGFEGHILLQWLEEGAGLRLRGSCWRFWNMEGQGQSVIVGASSGMDVQGQRKEEVEHGGVREETSTACCQPRMK